MNTDRWFHTPRLWEILIINGSLPNICVHLQRTTNEAHGGGGGGGVMNGKTVNCFEKFYTELLFVCLFVLDSTFIFT